MIRPKSAAYRKQERHNPAVERAISNERISQEELLNSPIYNEDSLIDLKNNLSNLSRPNSQELKSNLNIHNYLIDYTLQENDLTNETAYMKHSSPGSDSKNPAARHIRNRAIYLPNVIKDKIQSKPETCKPHKKTAAPIQIQSLKTNQSSTQTIIEKQEVSNAFNSTNLKLAMNKYFETERQLRDIFKHEDIKKFQRLDATMKAQKPKTASKSPKSKKLKTDCFFSFEQANVVLNELLNNKEIHKPKHWNQILKTMKEKPKILMNLIPVKKIEIVRTPKSRASRLDTTTIYGITPKNRTFIGTRSSAGRKLSTTSRNTNLNTTQIPDFHKPQRSHMKPISRHSKVKRSLSSSPQLDTLLDTAVSLTPIHFETFYDVKSDKDLTDDWSHSYLNHNLKIGHTSFNHEHKPELFAKIDVERALSKITRDQDKLNVLHARGQATLQYLLIELLGTKEDAARFSNRFGDATCNHVRSLLAKCLDLFKVRGNTKELLVKIHNREKLIKLLKSCTDKERSKKILVEIYKCGKELRNQITAWENNPDIPFDRFMYKGKVYTELMAEEIVKLQESLVDYLTDDECYSNIFKTYS